MNVLLFSMPDSFEHMPPVAIRMPNGALSSLAGNVDPHHRVMTKDFRERGLIINERLEEYDGTTAVVRSEHLHHLPKALAHSPWFGLRHGARMLAHTFRGSTLRSLLGFESERAAFARYRAIRKAERAYV